MGISASFDKAKLGGDKGAPPRGSNAARSIANVQAHGPVEQIGFGWPAIDPTACARTKSRLPARQGQLL